MIDRDTYELARLGERMSLGRARRALGARQRARRAIASGAFQWVASNVEGAAREFAVTHVRCGRVVPTVETVVRDERHELVGRMVTVDKTDPLAGLIVWVSVDPVFRGLGLGLHFHAVVARHLGHGLMIDLAVSLHDRGHGVPGHDAWFPGANGHMDSVRPAEYRVWDGIVRSSDWDVRFWGYGRFVVGRPSICTVEGVRS
jgi:hypothetical protein